MGDWINVVQALALSGVSRRTLYYWMADGYVQYRGDNPRLIDRRSLLETLRLRGWHGRPLRRAA